MHLRLFILLILGCAFSSSFAQLNGVIVNQQKRPIELVHVHNLQTNKGRVSNQQGQFTIEVNNGDILKIDHINYQPKYIQYSNALILDTIVLIQKDYSLNEINISSSQPTDNYLTNKSQIDFIPSFLGEQDVLKYIATLPGVSSISMLDAGIYVRGGNSSQNAYLINNVPVSNPNHLTGILSTFDPYILGTSRFYKSAYPVQYNGYLASYINMKPNLYTTKKLNGELNAGLLASSIKFKLNTGKQNRSTLGFSLRQSYYHLMANAYNKKNGDNIPSYNFRDLTTSYSHQITNNWHANFTLMSTNDKLPLDVGNRFNYKLDWNTISSIGNIHGSLTKNTNLTFSLGYNTYSSKFDATADVDTQGDTETENYFASLSATTSFGKDSKVNYGLNYTAKHYYLNQQIEDNHHWNENNNLAEAFAEYHSSLTNTIDLILGINANTSLNNNNRGYLSPRGKIAYTKNNLSVWLDYTDTRQYEEQMMFFTLKSPVDMLVPITEGTPSQSQQVAIGSRLQPNMKWTINGAVFVKKLSSIKDFNSNDRVNLEESITHMVDGKGKAYGFELDGIYKSENVYARLNYTLSEVKHQFEEINNGNWFNPPYDIRHNILLNSSIRISKSVRFNAMWIYMTGTNITIPIGVAIAKDIVENSMNVVPVYGNRYNYQLPANHRLDVNFQWKKNIKTDIIRFDIGAYNLYNQQNPSFVFVEPQAKDTYFVQFNLKSRVMLPFMPYLSVSYHFNR